MATMISIRVSDFVFWSLLFAFFVSLSVSQDSEVSLVLSESTSLKISPSLKVQSPGTKPGTSVNCGRVQIHGLSRLNGIKKFAHTIRVKVLQTNSSILTSFVDVCFHRNVSLGIGMCPQGKWVRLTKGSWIQSMSPFDHRIIDIRMIDTSIETIEVSIEEEFYLYRVIFLCTGIILWTLAPTLSQSLVFYYSSAMTVGVLLVILMVLFQGMKLLPTGRKNSLAIFLYSSIAGLGSYLLRYLPKLWHSLLVEIGISEDLYYPVAIILLVFIVLLGAWLGFWFVRKLVLSDDGTIETSISTFVTGSIRVFSAILLTQTTLDVWLALESLGCGILISIVLKRFARRRFLRTLYRRLFKRSKNSHIQSYVPESLPFEDSFVPRSPLFEGSHENYMHEIRRPRDSFRFLGPRVRPFTPPSCSTTRGLTKTPPSSQSSGSESYFSTFHTTPDRRKFSKDEWKKFTEDSTKKALQGLASSPDFSKWAVSNADRLTLRPNTDFAPINMPRSRARWFFWSNPTRQLLFS